MARTTRTYLRTLGLLTALGLSPLLQGCGVDRATPGMHSAPATTASGSACDGGAACAGNSRYESERPDWGVPYNCPLEDRPDFGVPNARDRGMGCEPCQHPARCCTPADLVCAGTPDDEVTCICERLWSCAADGSMCQQDAIDGLDGSLWACEVDGAHLVCTAPGAAGEPPAPLDTADPSRWRCAHLTGAELWRCQRETPANPCHTAKGSSEWSCATPWRGKVVCYHL